jgi:UPF0176 protein
MFLNLASYRFVDLDQLPQRRRRIDELGSRIALKGTVLLASEGINLNVCGPQAAIRAWADELRSDPLFATLVFNERRSSAMPFKRWRVRIKNEIITFRRPAIRPQDRRAASVSPAVLERWLDAGRDDEGRELVMIDTRNEFEVQAGSFESAIDLKLASFTELPEAVAARRAEWRGRRVVTFCTGGIRCEKAALYLQHEGIDHVVQLEGGVLRYFDTIGGAHWRGELFVFDARGVLSPAPERVSS